MEDAAHPCPRVCTAGKFLRLGNRKWYVKGFSYGPFAANSQGEPLPERSRLRDDFAHIRAMQANTIRVYYPPPRWLLDDALDYGLRVLIDVPWEKHRCFFEDWEARQRARQAVRGTARELGDHPAVLAISVANELPNDVVRFYGHRRVERFLEELLDSVKQESPECLATLVNFPTTEFLAPAGCDFCCFNVYLHDAHTLGAYLDRLQHLAGNTPLVLGEYGIDTLRHSEAEQAELLAGHLTRVFRHGLAGSIVFSYTDDWFTGGHQIDDWAFGVTRADRSEKRAADCLAGLWEQAPHVEQREWPKVSVVVCSYNGAATLEECLRSLMKLNYPDYEVILVDDGSQDHTPQIAAEFPQIVYVRQPNRGLSVARNVGARRATGEVVAYTDSDCVADQDWLRYLVQAMQDQQVEAIGGPNITPCSDGWVAKCVAASPGNPSHVMLDDRCAEHIPGCNMAFRRDVLLGLGGFDAQFRQAGDDVDVCWRLLDAGLKIGYAPGAMVWHHRRSTVRAYAKQQKGYGRAEAMVYFKHPQRFGPLGRSTWQGIIYGDGAVGLPLLPPVIYHGRFGSALFQSIYRHNDYGAWACLLSLEWHLGAVFVLVLATLYWPLALVSLLMGCGTLALASRAAWQAPLPRRAPWWCRPLVAGLYVLQPLIRGWHRQTYLLSQKTLPPAGPEQQELRGRVKRISSNQQDLYWHSDQARGREQLLEMLVEEAPQSGWTGHFDDDWASWDVKLLGDRWHNLTVRTATEELGWPQRFTRARCAVQTTLFSRIVAAGSLLWLGAALLSRQPWAIGAGLVAVAAWSGCHLLSRRRCLRAVAALLVRAGKRAGLEPVDRRGQLTASPASHDAEATGQGRPPATVPDVSLDSHVGTRP